MKWAGRLLQESPARGPPLVEEQETMGIILERVTPHGRIRTRRNARPVRPLDQDRRDLAAGNIPLAIDQAKRLVRRRHMDLAEAIAVALHGLAEAASRFDTDRGVHFAGYASLVVRCQLTQAADQHTRHKCRTRQHAEERDEAELPDGREARPEEAPSTAEVIARLRAVLRPKDFALLWERFAVGRSCTDLAADRGVSKQSVSEAVHLAIDRARRACPEFCGQ